MKNSQKINQNINYQEGSVVSKEIINKPTGTVTLFAFSKGQGLSTHTTPYDALIIVSDGVAEVTVAGVKHIVNAGDMLVMPANSPHELKAIEHFKMMLTMIKS